MTAVSLYRQLLHLQYTVTNFKLGCFILTKQSLFVRLDVADS